VSFSHFVFASGAKVEDEVGESDGEVEKCTKEIISTWGATFAGKAKGWAGHLP